MKALSAVGGDSRVVLRYAVLRRSVESSSRVEIFVVVGGGVCEADEFTSFGSVSSLYVHCSS